MLFTPTAANTDQVCANTQKASKRWHLFKSIWDPGDFWDLDYARWAVCLCFCFFFPLHFRQLWRNMLQCCFVKLQLTFYLHGVMAKCSLLWKLLLTQEWPQIDPQYYSTLKTSFLLNNTHTHTIWLTFQAHFIILDGLVLTEQCAYREMQWKINSWDLASEHNISNIAAYSIFMFSCCL